MFLAPRFSQVELPTVSYNAINPSQTQCRQETRWQILARMMLKPQFGFRSVLILFVLVSFWLATWTNQARRQREAIVEIERLGGIVYYGKSIFAAMPYVEDMFLPVEEVQFPSDSRMVTEGDAVIPFLKRLPHLQRILLFPPQDEMVPKLRSALPGVEFEVITGAFLFLSDRYSTPNDR